MPFFLHNQPEIPQLVNDLVLKSFKQQMPSQLDNYLNLIKFIFLYNLNLTIDINYLNNKISNKFKFKYWQINNPYIKTEGTLYPLEVNKKIILTSWENAIIWQWLNDGASLLINKNNRIPLTGYDNKKHNNLIDFIASFAKNLFIKEHLSLYLQSKIEKAKTNKQEWRACSLTFLLPEKNNKEKLNKI